MPPGSGAQQQQLGTTGNFFMSAPEKNFRTTTAEHHSPVSGRRRWSNLHLLLDSDPWCGDVLQISPTRKR